MSRTRYGAALAAVAVAALIVVTGPAASAGPLPTPPVLPSLPPLPPLPSLPVPPLPSLPVPPLPVPTGKPPLPTPALPTPALPALPALPGQPPTGPPATPTVPPVQPPVAPTSGATPPTGGNAASAMTVGDALAIITNDPSADLYPQPPVDPASTAPSRLVARLDELQHRVQYLHNVLTRTRADLTVAQAQLDSVSTLITMLAAPAAPAPGAPDSPQGRALALSAAIASAESELARTESAVETLRQQVNNAVQQTLTTQTRVPTGTTTYANGKLRRPVPGRITSPFGNRFDPYYHVWQLHAGIDIGTPAGTGIIAAAAGRVTRAGWAGGYGRYTCIDHGNVNGQRLSTCYAHQQAILVEPGQQVSAGQVIGQVGSTGASTGPHLHFEVRLGGRPVDPMPWL